MDLSEILSPAQMRAIEAAAIESRHVTGLELMERAGKGAVAAIAAQWPGLGHSGGRALVLCGPGNNGGDGFVVARLLQERGWSVALHLLGTVEKLSPDARVNAKRWLARGGTIAPLDVDSLTHAPDADMLVDALFGTGLARELGGPVATLAEGQAKDAPLVARTVALDIPSGLCARTGRALGAAFRAALTVAFHRAKTGHYLREAPQYCGNLAIVGIGLRAECKAALRLTRPRLRHKAVLAHKYSHGHALVLAGHVGKAGAARLAARGTLRIGAGLVTLCCPPAGLLENAAHLDAIMLRALRNEVDLAEILQDGRIAALCLGPGMGTAPREAALVQAALDSAVPLVLDADALSLLAADPALRDRLHAGCVVTPHMGEFARLCPGLASELASGGRTRIEIVQDAARMLGCSVLLKGAATVIASPSGELALNSALYDRAAPWLATAGAGDVLAGIITGLIAQGASPFEAACSAAWLHVEAARQIGPGLIAEDLAEQLPAILRRASDPAP